VNSRPGTSKSTTLITLRLSTNAEIPVTSPCSIFIFLRKLEDLHDVAVDEAHDRLMKHDLEQEIRRTEQETGESGFRQHSWSPPLAKEYDAAIRNAPAASPSTVTALTSAAARSGAHTALMKGQAMKSASAKPKWVLNSLSGSSGSTVKTWKAAISARRPKRTG